MFVVFATICFSCSNVNQTIEYNDNIDVRYLDSFEIISSKPASQESIEYVDKERVYKKVLIDTRIKGSHILGLYAPQGEKLVVEIPEKQIEIGHKIVINNNLPNEQEVVLTSARTEIDVLYGGIVEFIYSGEENSTNCMTIYIDGAIESSYYRYGLDSKNNIDSIGKFTTLDASNVRIYVPNAYVDYIENPNEIMLWWRNAIDLFDRCLSLSYYKNDFSSIRLYIYGDYFDYDISENAVYIPTLYASTILKYDNLSSGDGDKLYDILSVISEAKIELALKDTTKVYEDYTKDVLSSFVYSEMVDSTSADFTKEINYCLSSAKCMQIAIDQSYIDNTQKYVSFIMNLYYAYGGDEIIEDFDYIATKDIFKFLMDIVNKHNANIVEYVSSYGLAFSSEDIEVQKDNNPFYFVANEYSFGLSDRKNQTGLHFKMGESVEIDFNAGLISKEDENWVVTSVSGEGWSYVKDGVYLFTPNAEKLKNDFTITITNGDKEIELKSRTSVDIAVSNYKMYSNISYEKLGPDKLNSAIKSIDKDMSPSLNKALLKAEVPQEEEVDTTSYSLAVTTGCLEVPKESDYTFYLKSSGLCKVVFGVKDQDFVMFENILTVGEYTNELKYEIKLQVGFKYYYTIYNLSNKGSGYAKLGILESDISLQDVNDDDIDINEDYLVYNDKHLTRDDIVKFDSKNRVIDFYEKQDKTTNSFSYGKIREHSSNLTINQTASSLEITGNVEQDDMAKFIVPLYSSSKIEYLNIQVNDMEGVRIKLTAEADFTNVLVDDLLKNGLNSFEIDSSKSYSEYRVEFYNDSDFAVSVTGLEFGENIKELEIVPSTSTEIEYIGEWSTIHTYNAINGSLSQSHSQASSFKYSFNGDYIAVYAVKDSQFGGATIYIDGSEVTTIDLYSDTTMCTQLVFNAKLKEGDHVIEIKANGETPINIDYCAVSKLGETRINNDFSKIWYIVFIPSAVFIAMIVCIALDIKEKIKRKKQQHSQE